MSQISPIASQQQQAAPVTPPPPPPAQTQQLSLEVKQKIAAIYAEAQSEHKSQASVQQQINAVLATNPAASTSETQSLLIDTTA